MFIIFLTTLTNCENESAIQSNQNPDVIQAKNWLDKNDPKLSILNYSKEIDWDHAIVTDGSKGKVVEVPIILNDNIKIKRGDEIVKSYNRLMFIKDNTLTFKLSHILITSEKENFDITDEKFNFYNLQTDFEGTVTVLNNDDKIDYYAKISKKLTSSTSSKTNLEEQSCIYVVRNYDDGSYDVISLLFCLGGGSGSGDGGSGSGGSGGYGDNPSPEPNPCEESINNLINSSYSTSEFLGSTIIEENNTTRIKNYKWIIFSGPGYTLSSSETGIHKKVTNSNPALQWEFTNLTHNAIYKEGIVAGGEISNSLIYAQPTIGIYNSIMDLNYNVVFNQSVCGKPVSKERNYSAVHNFNIND